MGAIEIPKDDQLSTKDFEAGNSIQVRTKVSSQEANEYRKGQHVTIIHDNQKLSGKIVSDPIVIDENKESGRKTLSLIVEKSG